MKYLQTSYTQKNKFRVVIICCAVFCIVTTLASLCLGPVTISTQELFAVLFEGDRESSAANILLYVRVPRTIATLLAGIGLAVSGVIIQAVLANPLASPNIVGVNSGAGFAVALCGLLFPAQPWITPFFAFGGALFACLLVYAIAQKTGASRMTLILTGIAIGSCLSAGIDAIVTFFPDVLGGSTSFRIGGVAGVSMNVLGPAACYILLGFAAVLTLHNEMDILSMGDETAQSLGVSVKRTRFLLLLIAAAMAGAAVSFAGLIGFVGLIVPHACRFFVGSESGKLLPVSALGGAAFLTLCDLVARLIFAPYELPTGILLSFLGGPFFIFLLLQQKRGRIHD